MKKVKYKILPGEDLTEAQVYTTLQTFNRNAEGYAKEWEWNKDMLSTIIRYNIEPFTKYVKSGSTCLVAGCQSGRDYQILTERGLSCIGTSYSEGLLTEALKRVPSGIYIHSDIRKLPFVPESFDSIYADALTRIPRRDVKQTVKNFKIFLKKKGYIYLSFRIGQNGIYIQEDLVGKRYLTIYNKDELLELLKDTGLRIEWSSESEHIEKTLPTWINIIAQKM